MNERLKLLRKQLKLSQEQFANKIGVTNGAISNYEKGRRTIPDSIVLSICREFNVNDEWLKFGTGEMFNDENSMTFEEYAESRGLTELEADIIRGYLSLDKDTRDKMMNMLRDIVSKFNQEKESQEMKRQAYIDNQVENYRRQLELEVRATEESSASQEQKDDSEGIA